MSTIPQKISIGVLALLLSACSDSSPPPESVVEARPAEVEAFDLEAWMNEMAAVLQERCDLSVVAINDPHAFTRAQADRLSDTYYDEAVLTGLLENEITAHPDWLESICGWYDTSLRPLHFRQGELFLVTKDADAFTPEITVKLYDLADDDPASKRTLGAMVRANGTMRYHEEFPHREHSDFRVLTDLYRLCFQSQHIQE